MEEERTLDDFMDQRTQAVLAPTRALDDSFNFGAVAEGHGRAGGIDRELPGEVAGEEAEAAE